MGKVIVIASGKGGTGKTTSVAALSSCMAALGYKTLSMDCDAGLKNLDLALAMSDFAVADFSDVIGGLLPLYDACTESPHIPNLFLLSAPALSGPENIDRGDMAALFREIRAEFDYCFVDAPSGIGAGLALAACGADMAIVISTSDLASMRDAQRTVQVLGDMQIPEIRLLINRVALGRLRKIGATADDIIDSVGAQLIGVVAEDKTVFLAPHEHTPLILHEKRRAAYHFLDIARRIAGEDIPLKFRTIRF